MRIKVNAPPTRKPGVYTSHAPGLPTPETIKTIRSRANVSSGSRFAKVGRILALPKTKLPMVEDEA